MATRSPQAARAVQRRWTMGLGALLVINVIFFLSGLSSDGVAILIALAILGFNALRWALVRRPPQE
jgi:hypothetical protein